MSTQRVQVLIPTYNRRHSLEVSLPALLAQTHTNWFLTIIENNSSDGTADWIRDRFSKELASGKFQLVVYDQTVPIIANWNRAVDHVQECDYIKFLWSDDNLKPTFLEEAVAALEAGGQEFAGFSSAIEYRSEEGRLLGNRTYGPGRWALWGSILYRNRVGCPSCALLRATAYQGIHFDESNRYCADMLYMLHPVLAKQMRYAFSSKGLVEVTVAAGTETNTLFASELMQNNRSQFRKNAFSLLFPGSPFTWLLEGGITLAEKVYFAARSCLLRPSV